MVRLALFLLLANVGYFAWSQGWLHGTGLAPERQGEPQRVAQQIRPEALRVVARAGDVDAGPAVAATAGSPAATGCLQAGPFDGAEAATLEAALARMLPAHRWRLEPAPRGTHRLEIAFDAALREKLPALKTVLAGKPLEPCDPDPPR